MDNLVQHYWSRALKIARQFETGDIDFADLTGLSDEFAASFIEQVRSLPEPSRIQCNVQLEKRLTCAISRAEDNCPLDQALGELLVSINRTPIY